MHPSPIRIQPNAARSGPTVGSVVAGLGAVCACPTVALAAGLVWESASGWSTLTLSSATSTLLTGATPDCAAARSAAATASRETWSGAAAG